MMQGVPLISGAVDVPAFDRKALIRALRIDQSGESTFPEFLAASWRAGVVRYDVDFAARKVAYQGPSGEEYVEDYPAADEDITIMKYTSFGPEGKFKLSIRVEFYDLFNRHYYDNPVTDITSPLFGYVTSVSGTSRNGQFGARLEW